MIRLFIFAFFRFFIAAIAIYLVLTFIKGVIRALQGKPYSSSNRPRSETTPKQKEEYKDVQDARFVEIPDKQNEDKTGSK